MDLKMDKEKCKILKEILMREILKFFLDLFYLLIYYYFKKFILINLE